MATTQQIVAGVGAAIALAGSAVWLSSGDTTHPAPVDAPAAVADPDDTTNAANPAPPIRVVYPDGTPVYKIPEATP